MDYVTAPTGQDVADFLGQGNVDAAVALAQEHAPIVTAMARAYTRGNGFNSSGECTDDLAAVITAATARLVANPEQISYQVGTVRMSGGFKGWSLAETMVLNRYRKRAQ